MMKIGEKDEFFAETIKPQDFTFDERVASVFDDMASRSVPTYDETRSTALGLANHFVQENTNVYDLGCSTATLLIDFAELIENPTVTLIGKGHSLTGEPAVGGSHKSNAFEEIFAPIKDHIDTVYFRHEIMPEMREKDLTAIVHVFSIKKTAAQPAALVAAR